MSKTKGGLGKGLSALIRPAEQPVEHQAPPMVDEQKPTAAPIIPAEPWDAPVSQAESGTIAQLELAKIRPNPYQPRADFDPGSLDELKQSIREKGIIQPITVRRAGDGMYELISGERRVRACNELGLLAIPAYVIEVRNEQEMLELALVENLQREHLNPIEIAISYQRLMNDIGLSAEDIGKKVSKDRSTVVNFLRLLKLPERIRTAVRKGVLSTGHARAILGAPDEQTQLKIFDRVAKNDLSVRQVEKLVREFGKPPMERKSFTLQPPKDSTIASIESRIRQILATKVNVTVHSEGRGTITIEFYSNDDLGRLLDLFSTIEP
jgi:ParB family chromosome partitioning protein